MLSGDRTDYQQRLKVERQIYWHDRQPSASQEWLRML